jgi:uncharacterized membrane protein
MGCTLHHLLGHAGHKDTHTHASQEPTPLDILKRRFAEGEISREQVEEMTRVLDAVERGSTNARHLEHS